MAKFDTNVQELKYKVLREVATLAYEDRLSAGILDIPETIVPGPKATMRCCIYKERAIVNERVKLAMGGDPSVPGVVEVLNIACDECPVSQVTVGPSCRGCIAHRCQNACPKDAITMVNHHAVIDQSKCIACGRCVSACPYGAINKNTRPCERACKVNAISMDENRKASINAEKCISCGACVYQCPFGAIMDKSYILDAIRILRESDNNTKYQVYAVVAPSIAGQFGARVGQVVSAIKQLGFRDVVEAALGADMVAYKEAAELAEKGFLTSSCCPAFVMYIKKNFPKLAPNISHNVSPMVQAAMFIKALHPDSKTIFIGPCVAKKAEQKWDTVKDWIDCVITFEELQALIDSREIDLASQPDVEMNNASYYGRIFARSGGLSDAVAQALKEQGITEEQFKLKAIACSGIEECKMALLKANKGVLPENFIEGMACEQGCIGGAACLTHGPKEKIEVDKYGKLAMEKNITEAVQILQMAEQSAKQRSGD